MAKKTLGVLIKEARTNADMTQEQLARKVAGVSASDISKAERDVAPLSQEAIKKIAKVTNVTQKSLLDALKTTKYSDSSKSSGSGTTGRSSTGRSTTGRSTAGKTSASKTSDQEVKLTNAEKKLLSLYRAADSVKREMAIKILESDIDTSGFLGGILSSKTGDDTISSLLKGAKELLGK